MVQQAGGGIGGAARARGKGLSLLEITRPAGLFMVAADVMAGYIVARHGEMRVGELALLMLSGAAIYAAGAVFNDLCDADRDARERAWRAIPSGRVACGEAFILSCALVLAGMLFALAAGPESAVVALVLVFPVALYDIGLKDMALAGPLCMGINRAMGVLLGMSPALGGISEDALFLPIVVFVCVFSVTMLSRFEAGGMGLRWKLRIFTGWALAGFITANMVQRGVLGGISLIFLAAFVLLTARKIFDTLVEPKSDTVRGAVASMALCVPVLDAAFAAGRAGFAYGLPVAACSLAAYSLGRYFQSEAGAPERAGLTGAGPLVS